MSTGEHIPYSQAIRFANRFVIFLQPYCEKIEIAGSLRRRCEDVGDIEIVVVPKSATSIRSAIPVDFEGLTVDGERLKRFKYPDHSLQIELYITTREDFGRIFAVRTGSSAYSHLQLASIWNRNGWCGTVDGLRRKKECNHKGTTWKIKPEFASNPTLPPAFETEEIFFRFLGIVWIPPENRSWTSRKPELNYSV